MMQTYCSHGGPYTTRDLIASQWTESESTLYVWTTWEYSKGDFSYLSETLLALFMVTNKPNKILYGIELLQCMFLIKALLNRQINIAPKIKHYIYWVGVFRGWFHLHWLHRAARNYIMKNSCPLLDSMLSVHLSLNGKSRILHCTTVLKSYMPIPSHTLSGIRQAYPVVVRIVAGWKFEPSPTKRKSYITREALRLSDRQS